MGMEQVNQQQLAVLSNLSATEGLNQVLRSELERETNADNATKIEGGSLKKALEGKTANLGTEIIAKLVSNLAQQLPAAKVLQNLKDDYGFVLDPEEENSQDFVDIKSVVASLVKPQKQKGQNQQGSADLSGREGEAAPRTDHADIKEYIGAYSQMLVNGGSETKKKLEQMETALLREKISPKELQNVKLQVASSVRSEVLQQIKQAFLKRVLTKGKSLEYLMAKKEFNNFVDYAFLNVRLGGYDFGGYEEHLQGAVDKAREESYEELKDFVKDDLTKEVMKKAMGSESKEAEKDIEQLLKLGQRIGFDLQEFLAKIPKLKEDLGVNPAIAYEYVSPDAGMDNGDRGRHRYQYTPEEEKEVLTDKLRAVYLRRALYGDVRTVLETQFKMVKLKNGLIRLGVKNFDQVEAQGRALAKIKLFEMLKEAFAERATYAKLSGPAWKMTEKKIKTVLKNLEKIGVEPSSSELEKIRDRANERMHEEAKHELDLINTAIAVRGEISYLTSRRKMAEQILERLAEESGFAAPGKELQLTVKEAC